MITYRPRNDQVLVRIVPVEDVRGIKMPQVSIEGKNFRVEAMGPKVEGLSVGDHVLMIGRKGTEYYPLPNCNDLLIIRQEFVALIVEGEEE